MITGPRLRGGKLMHVNNFNRVICAAAKVLVDKEQSTNSAYMQKDKGRLQRSCKVLKENRTLFSGQKEEQSR